MNVNIDNLEHVLSTLNGFESLSSGDLTSPDSVYAKTVLKLNGVDFKGREGSESFLTSVKAGATKVYEMIKNFIKAIRDFFFGSKGSKQTKTINDAVKETENTSKEIMNKKNDKDFDPYRLEKERIERLMDNEKIKLETDRCETFIRKYSENIFTTGMVGSRLKEIPGISLTDLRSKATQLEDINSNIGLITEKHATKFIYTENNQRISIFEVIPPLVELQKLFNKMRTIATETLGDVTKDLEHNNELAKKQENSSDIESKYHSDKVRTLCKKLVTVSNSLTNLINYCDSKITRINQVIEGVKELTSK